MLTLLASWVTQPPLHRFSTLAIWASLLIGAATAKERPDILMIVVDDLRPMLGCYGDTRIRTPNIDLLASRSVVFENAYCQYAKCGTSRLSLLTGLRPDAIGVFSNNERDVLAFRKRREDAHSMPAWLKQNGYHTQSFGKIYHDGWDDPDDWSVTSFPGRQREMWEVVDAENPSDPTIVAQRLSCPVIQSPEVSDDHLFAGRMTNKVLESIRNHSLEQPTFLAVGYRRPHLPFIAPKKYFDLYKPDASWLTAQQTPSPNAPVMAWFNSDGYIGAAKHFGLTMPPSPSRQQAIDLNGFELRSYLGVPKKGTIDEATQIKLLHAYAACVSYVDAQIGRVMEGLQQSGRSENTIVLLFADHGWHLGEHSAWGKMTNFEWATRVPLIISAPGFAPGKTKSIAELVDLYPTICELSELPPPPHLEGESLVPALGRTDSHESTQAVSQYSRFRDHYMGRAIRTPDFRYVAWFDTGSDEIVARELYDHRNDPTESNNLAGQSDYNAVRTELEQRLIELRP